MPAKQRQENGQPECAAPARRRGRPLRRLTPKRSRRGLGRWQRFARSSGHQNGLSSRKSEPESSVKLDQPVLETCRRLRPPPMRHGRDELVTRPDPRTGTDRTSNRQLSGGFPARTDSRFSPFLHFQPDSGNAQSLFRQDEPLVMKRRVIMVVSLEQLCGWYRERKNRAQPRSGGHIPCVLEKLETQLRLSGRWCAGRGWANASPTSLQCQRSLDWGKRRGNSRGCNAIASSLQCERTKSMRGSNP